MQKTRYSFDKNVSSQLKAFALVLMIMHHLWHRPYFALFEPRLWASVAVYWGDGQDLRWHVPVCLWLWANGFLLLCRKCLSYLEEAEEGVVALLVDCHPGSAFLVG